MSRITIRCRNPKDVTLDEVEVLAQAIRKLLPGQDVEVLGKDQQEGAYGITWFQIVDIVLPFAGAAGALAAKEVIQQITKAGIDWARSRFKSKGHPKPRPVYIPIYGPDGKIVKSVVINNASDEPEDRTEQDRKLFG